METSKRRDCDAETISKAKHPFPDGMETSKRRDCDSCHPPPFLNLARMEWRPQKEGIATRAHTRQTLDNLRDGMETSKRRDCDFTIYIRISGIYFDGMETSKRRDCDLIESLAI